MKRTTSLYAAISVLFAGVRAVKPKVDLGYSKYVGTPLANGLTQWLGIRYAAPPVDALRWMAPADPVNNDTVQRADKNGPWCLGTGESVGASISEDCLFLDVFAPSHATRCSKLPVFVYITGGGFNKNANSNKNGTGIAAAANNEMVVVFFNYRVGPYGFMTTGDTERDDIDSNVGLLDQRKVLDWVQKHISKFGGDPRHVVLGGGSAGAASITYHLTAYDGKDEGLFIGTAAESQSFGPVLTASDSRYQFVNLATNLGCWRDGNDTAVLSCMRRVPAAEIQTKNKAIPYPPPKYNTTAAPTFMWGPYIDGTLIKDLTYTRFLEGKFIRVPSIWGDVTNGGSMYAPTTTSTLQESNQFFRNQFPKVTNQQLSKLDELFVNPNNTCPNVGCYWRHAANVYGEARYLCPGFFLADVFASFAAPKSYQYWWDVKDPAAEASGYGVVHVVETYSLFGPENNNNAVAPASYLPDGINAITGPIIRGYWASFIRTLDPNQYRYNGSAQWES